MKTELCPNLEEEVLRDQNSKNYSFTNQSIDNPKFSNIFKMQSPKSMSRVDLRIFPNKMDACVL